MNYTLYFSDARRSEYRHNVSYLFATVQGYSAAIDVPEKNAWHEFVHQQAKDVPRLE